jgi:hypothetical protein
MVCSCDVEETLGVALADAAVDGANGLIRVGAIPQAVVGHRAIARLASSARVPATRIGSIDRATMAIVMALR